MWIKGFTVIELLVTMAILAILATIGVPSMKDILENNRLRSASEELYQRLYTAKSQAIDKQQSIYVKFSSGTNWCYGTNTLTNCDCAVTTSCTLGKVSNSSNNVNLAITGFTNSEAHINSNRGTFASSGSITFSLNGKSVVVSASRMGRIRICSDTVGGYKSCT